MGLLWLYVCFLLAGAFHPAQPAKAASAAMNLSLSADEIMLGETFSVVLTVESSEDIGNLEVYLSFDRKALRFISGGKYVTGGKGLVMILDETDQTETDTKKKYSMKFKALKGGETTLKIRESEIACASDGLVMSVSKNQLLFQVIDPERMNDNAELKSLSIDPGTLSPEFSADTTVYRTEVGSDVNQLRISAAAAEKNAQVRISGNQDFVTGKNEVQIKVTAPSGDIVTTTITVIKLAPGETPQKAGDASQGEDSGLTEQGDASGEEDEKGDAKAPGDASEKESSVSGSLKLSESAGLSAREEEGGDIYVTDYQEIKIRPLDDDSRLPQDFIATTVVITGVPVVVYTPSYDLNSELLLMYGENFQGKSGFYLYNRKTGKIRPYDGEFSEAEVKEDSSKSLAEQEVETYRHTIWGLLLLSVILGLFCAGLMAALLLQSIKRKKQKKKRSPEDEPFPDYFDI